jgi:hypothetical protein
VHEPESLLAEIAAAVQSDTDADVLVEAAEFLVAEQSRLRLVDRWRMGEFVRVGTCLGAWVQGHVLDAGTQLLLLQATGGALHAIAVPAIVRVRGLDSALRPEEPMATRAELSWPWWLRRRDVVTVTCRDGWQEVLQIASVGADHFDGWSQARTLESVPFSALVHASARGTPR